jgi:hypothetical protein
MVEFIPFNKVDFLAYKAIHGGLIVVYQPISVKMSIYHVQIENKSKDRMTYYDDS